MAMHLGNVPVYMIMLIGRWRSDAFLRYLRPQVMLFTAKISARMIQYQHFFSVPSMDPHAGTTNPNNSVGRSRTFASSCSNGREATGLAQSILPRTPFNITIT
jgi:hypothetical protein